MKTNLIAMTLILALAGCGGNSSKPTRGSSGGPVPAASGPISGACLSSGRSARSRQLCGCIQAVANQSLSTSQQRRAASFYSNPQIAQNVRQSDRAADERFWKTYKAYSERAEQVCRRA